MRWLGPVLRVVAGLIVAFPLQTFAQGADAGVMTVDDVVARALADNPDLRAARAEVDAAVGRVRQAGLRPNPMLEVGGQKAISPDNNFSIGVTLPLDLNGRVDGRVGVAQRELELKRAQVAERERRLAAEVRLKAGPTSCCGSTEMPCAWWVTVCAKGRRRPSRRTCSSSR
jgi:outer membrane protein TolC